MNTDGPGGDIALVGAKVVMGRLASAYQDAGFGFEKCWLTQRRCLRVSPICGFYRK